MNTALFVAGAAAVGVFTNIGGITVADWEFYVLVGLYGASNALGRNS